MTAPERIWAMPHRQLCWNEDNTNGVLVLGYYEYVRADLHDATKAQLEKTVEALKNLVQHAHNCEKELTEELHHMDFCGESLPLAIARAAVKGIK